MFALYPDGKPIDSSSSEESQVKTNIKFFAKLGFYFLAIRIAHIYLATDKTKESNRL